MTIWNWFASRSRTRGSRWSLTQLLVLPYHSYPFLQSLDPISTYDSWIMIKDRIRTVFVELIIGMWTEVLLMNLGQWICIVLACDRHHFRYFLRCRYYVLNGAVSEENCTGERNAAQSRYDLLSIFAESWSRRAWKYECSWWDCVHSA